MESAIGQPPPPPPPPPEPLAVTWTLDISNVPSNGGRVEHECPAVHCQDRIFGSYDYLDGQTASITARAYSGYRFSHWSGAASGSRSSRTVYMDRDRSVTAHWERIPATTYNLRVIADPSDGRGGYVEITGGTLVSAGTKRFIQGARAVVEARSNTGWRFVRWSGDRKRVQRPPDLNNEQQQDRDGSLPEGHDSTHAHRSRRWQRTCDSLRLHLSRQRILRWPTGNPRSWLSTARLEWLGLWNRSLDHCSYEPGSRRDCHL